MKYTKAQRKAIYERALEELEKFRFICFSINVASKKWELDNFYFEEFPEFELHLPTNYLNGSGFHWDKYHEGKFYTVEDFKPIREQILLNCIEMCK